MFSVIAQLTLWLTLSSLVRSATIYEIDFESNPSYLPQKSIVLTFDDGPDPTNTAKVLDVLKTKGVKATFFINIKNGFSSADVDTQPAMQDLVKRIVNEGHTLASHTYSHPHLATLSAAQIEEELAHVERTVDKIFGGAGPKLTLIRPPYGEPYTGGPSGQGYQLVAPILAKHGVSIGWNIDSGDYNCNAGDTNCVINGVQNKLKSGGYGIILMHSIHSQTASALPTLIDYFKNNGYQLLQVEDAVRGKYQKTSRELIV